MPVLSQERPSRVSVPGNKGIKLHHSILVQRPADACYAFWRNFQNLPHFMEHLLSVTRLSDKVWHWVAKGPAGRKVEWDAEVINEHPNSLIAWRTVGHPDVAHAGSIRFKPIGSATEVKVEMEFLPPFGRFGLWMAKIAGEDPGRQIAQDLLRFKKMIESGETPPQNFGPSGEIKT